MQPDAFADAVVMVVKNALGPVLERLAAAEARLAVLGDVRDRVVTIEAKAVPLVDPALLSALRERVVALETKATAVVDYVPSSVGSDAVAELRDRVVALETREPVPGPIGPAGPAGRDGKDGTDGIHGKDGEPGPPGKDGKDGLTGAEGKAGLDGKHGVDGKDGKDGRDGLAGKDGKDGTNGKDGKDGLDGLGWDDLAVVQEDERTFIVKATRGLQVKEFGRLTFPVEIYRGVYVEGKFYDRGDGVTYGGSEWHCNERTTTKPGDGSKAWTLKVKRGRDGRDGRDGGPPPTPVVTVKR